MMRNLYRLVPTLFLFATLSCQLQPAKSYRVGFLPNEVTQLLKDVNIITVCQNGKGDFSSIQTAIDSAKDSSNKKPYAILIYPGIYNEIVSLKKNYISLVGLDKKKVRIELNHATSGSTPHRNDAIVNVTGKEVNICNLSIRNTLENDGSGVTPAVHYKNGATGVIYNCYIGGNGGRDILDILWGAKVKCYFVTVEQYNSSSRASHPVWVATSGASLTFLFGQVINTGQGGGMQFQTNGKCIFQDTYFDLKAYLADVVKAGYLEFWRCKLDRRKTFVNSNYKKLVENFDDYGKGEITCQFIKILKRTDPAKAIERGKFNRKTINNTLCLQVLNTTFADPEIGDIYINSSVKGPQLRLYDGHNWRTLANCKGEAPLI